MTRCTICFRGVMRWDWSVSIRRLSHCRGWKWRGFFLRFILTRGNSRRWRQKSFRIFLRSSVWRSPALRNQVSFPGSLVPALFRRIPVVVWRSLGVVSACRVIQKKATRFRRVPVVGWRSLVMALAPVFLRNLAVVLAPVFFEEFGSGSGFAGLGGQIPAYRDELPAPPGFTPPLPAYQAPTPLPKERWWLFDYTDDQFAFRLSPVFGYGVRLVSGETNNIRWPGAKVFGYGGDWFGASFEYVDFGETGSNTDKSKKFTPVTGAFVNNQTGSTFEYSDVKGSVSFNWSWGYISVIKDYQTWGSGQFSQLILSTKAPSFTQVRFHVNPVSWFRFNYYQGWVNSLIYDSTAFFWSHPESISPSEITPYKDKYVVSNLATFTPVGWLDVSLGNAFVYGPHFRFETLIPFLYYKVMDHNTGRIRGDDGNGMIFFDFKVRSPRNFAFYGTAYIDVINLRDLLNGRFDNQWVAFTLGAKRYNLFLPMLDVSLEYTRINPWNYENRNDLTSYKHLGYQLGHWIGQNADQLRLQVNYSHFRGLRHFAYVEWVRKGIEADIAIAYNAKKFGTVPFLQSPLRSDFRFGFETAWEPFHELKLRGYYEFSSISDEDPLRTPKYLRGDNHSLGLILSYGI